LIKEFINYQRLRQEKNQESKKKAVIKSLKQKAKSAEQIFIATDPDREGEAIAAHVEDVISSNLKIKNQKSKIKRITFHEITKQAVEHALSNPTVINRNLVDAQISRRVLDRLVGYKISPLLWKKVRVGLSAGRVQTVAVRLIVEGMKSDKKKEGIVSSILFC